MKKQYGRVGQIRESQSLIQESPEIKGDYYSAENNRVFMSVSQLKGFLECEARQKAIVDGDFEQPYIRAFLIGHYVHSAFEGKDAHEEVINQNLKSLMKVKSLSKDQVVLNYLRFFDSVKHELDEMDERLYEILLDVIDSCVLKTSFDIDKEVTKIEKALIKALPDDELEQYKWIDNVKEMILNNQHIVHRQQREPYADIQQADLMIEKLKDDPLAMRYLDGQKEVEFTGELFGCSWKIRVDNVHFFKGFFSDLKTTQDIYGRHYSVRHGRYVSFIDRYGYDMQMAVYQQIIMQNTAEIMKPYIVAVSKQDIPNIAVVEMDQKRLDEALAYIEGTVDRAVAVKTGKVEPVRCERCDYCRKTKKLSKVISVDSLLEDY